MRKRLKRTCDVEGCERPIRAKGFCNMHYLRLRLLGDPGEAATRKGTGGTGHVSRTTGYRYFYRPSHPNATKYGQIAEHTMVMSKLLGRPLTLGESVHHRNGIHCDNCPENLELRSRYHAAGQSVLDMLAFCEDYIAKYSSVKEILLTNSPQAEGSS